MTRVELHHGGASDVGLVREANEDAYLTAPPVFVVADGMGGHDAGDVASRFVVEEFEALAESGVTGGDADKAAERVAATFRRVQERISAYDAEQQDAGAIGFSAGTTAVVAVLVEQDGHARWLLANIGDSRIYRYTEGGLEQVSVDHSVVQEMIDAGSITVAEAALHPSRHVITRALGASASGEADYFLLPLPAAERLLLCSDGVSGMIDDAQIAAILAETEDPATPRTAWCPPRCGPADATTRPPS
ncbi:PP2C family protein-serine/threonine phosphatase [Nocardioides sambongensis]|uniref:PP2C family protein-serine/threonine phosphatase n=1 Tax=Nocardioides sambongensis TaxID=2589074 RepID=UPI001E3A435D|nr:protein phosphatase 2C domain-containing protein [Nocardioides sambongensis]